MMFSNATWSVYRSGLTSSELLALGLELTANRDTDNFLFAQSALVARVSIENNSEDEITYGINPFSSPRQDINFLPGVDTEARKVEKAIYKALLAQAAQDPLLAKPLDVQKIPGMEDWTQTWADFRLSKDRNIYGFWLVVFTKKEIEDANSLKESEAYSYFRKPFKVLNGDERKHVGEVMEGFSDEVVARKQFPFYIDMDSGLIIGEFGGKKLEEIFLTTIGGLGLKPKFQTIGFNNLKYVDIKKIALGKLLDGSIDDQLLSELGDLCKKDRKDPDVDKQIKTIRRKLHDSLALDTWTFKYDNGNVQKDLSVRLTGPYGFQINGSKGTIDMADLADAYEVYKTCKESGTNIELVSCMVKFVENVEILKSDNKKMHIEKVMEFDCSPNALNNGTLSMNFSSFNISVPLKSEELGFEKITGREEKIGKYWLFYHDRFLEFVDTFISFFGRSVELENVDEICIKDAFVDNVSEDVTIPE